MDDYRSHLKPWVVTVGVLFMLAAVAGVLWLIYAFGEWFFSPR